MAQYSQSTLPASPPSGSSGQPIGNYRWVICALLFFATAINYIDRQVLGVLKPLLAHDLKWNEHDYANIVTAFQFTYALGYAFGGRLMDRFGVKRALPAAALLWSVFAAMHGFARSVTGFTIARLGLGLAEGGNFPAAIKTVGEWFPVRERALATGIFNSASNIGAVLCPLSIPALAGKLGWPAAFIITGALGIVWVVVWALVYQPVETNTHLTPGERAYIEEGRVQTEEPPVPWAALLTSRATWAYMVAGILAGPVWWFYLFWLPDFLQKRFHLTLVETGIYTGIIYGFAIIGSIWGGWLPARLLSLGWSLNRARKTALLVPALCVLPVFAAASVHNIWAAVIVVGVAAGSHQAWSANLYTFVSDTTSKRAVSSVVGLGGFASGTASMFVAQAVGVVLTKTGSYVPLFAWASTMYLLSFLFIQLLVPRIRLFK